MCVCARVCVRVAGGYFYVDVLNAIFFSNLELNTKALSCQTNIIWKNISSTTFLMREYFPRIKLKVNLCTSRRTQLQEKLEMSVSFVILS